MLCCGFRINSFTELLALIHGVIVCMLSSVGAVYSILGTIEMVYHRHQTEQGLYILGLALAVFWLVVSVILFVGALFLVIGMRYRNPTYVVAYFLLGLMLTLLFVILWIFMRTNIEVLFIIGAYALQLGAVWLAYLGLDGPLDNKKSAV